MRETKYQQDLVKKLHELFPDCIVIRGDPSRIQGVPDLIIFFEDRWAALEVKTSENAPQQPNQEWYVERMNEMSFASFIWPEVEAEVFSELQFAFGTTR